MDEKPEESTQRWHRIIAIALPIVAIAMAVYQLAFTQYLIQGPTTLVTIWAVLKNLGNQLII